jgi:hypothetical protein
LSLKGQDSCRRTYEEAEKEIKRAAKVLIDYAASIDRTADELEKK